MTETRSYFFLVVGDGVDAEGKSVPATDVAAARVDERRWPLYDSEGDARRIVPGDKALILIAGGNDAEQYLMGMVAILDVESGARDAPGADVPYRVLTLGRVDRFEQPVGIESLVSKGSLAGSRDEAREYLLARECRRIEEGDYRRIMDGL